jgi:hypothetical protein
MRQRVACTVVLMVAVAAASGCGEKQEAPSAPSAPEFHTITGINSGCDITHINQLVQSYFTDNDRRKTVKDSVTALDAAVDFDTAAKRLGFDIMAHIDTVVSNSTAGTPSVGSDLVNHLILCMYNPTTEAAAYPVTFPEDFTTSLTPTLHGAFKVKPPTSANNDANADPVLSRPVSAPFSGVGPSTGTWRAALSGGQTTPARILVYGRPVSGDPTSYDWKTIPHNSNFSPVVIVGICIDPASATKSLLNDDNVGLLPFVEAPFVVPGTCSPSTALLVDGPTMFAQRLLRMGASLFGPRELWAAAVLGGLGGTKGGIRTQFGSKVVPNVTLTFVQQPTSTTVNTVISPAVTIRATVQGQTATVPNVSITVGAVNNNGATVQLGGTTTQITDANGVATYNDLSENKSGASKLIVINAQVGNRPAIPVKSVTSAKFNIAPK